MIFTSESDRFSIVTLTLSNGDIYAIGFPVVIHYIALGSKHSLAVTLTGRINMNNDFDLDAFFREQDKHMNLPGDSDINDYLARMGTGSRCI